jgi:2-C-methyl-D-erythritol 4-phosphate cytidylyltransferase
MAVALLVAAGSGERLGADRPKAFVMVGGKSLLQWSLEALDAAGIDDVVIAMPREMLVFSAQGATVVPGGECRSESVRNALEVSTGDPVVVHDAARPLARPELFRRVLEELADSGADAVVAAAPVSDTVKRARDGDVLETLDRSQLWAVQTPQAFRREALEEALDVSEDVLAQATDDAWLVERAGGRVRVVPASPENFKITTPRDLRLAEELLLAD